jgi:hypothetical protein
MHASMKAIVLAAAPLLLAGSPALAQQDLQAPQAKAAPALELQAQPAQAPPSNQPTPLLFGPRFGVVIPTGNKLDTNFQVELEAAYQLPFIGRRLGIFFDFSYSRPTESGTRTDARVLTNGGVEDWKLVQHDVGFALGLHFWQPLPKNFLIYGGIGGKLHLLRTIIDASAGGADFGTNREDSTRVGALLRVGGAYKIGPGAIQLELQFEWLTSNHLITGGELDGTSPNEAHIALQIGYAFFLL